MKFYFGIFLFVFFYLLSCNQSVDKKDLRNNFYNEEGLLVKRLFYPDSSIKIERTYKDDTIEHGYAKQYYPEGQLKYKLSFKNGQLHGTVKEYYKNGEIKFIGWNEKGKQDSLALWYYENGQIEIKSFFYKGNRIGEEMHYYLDGEIKKYIFYNPSGQSIYQRHYDENGELLKEEGEKNIYIIYEGTDDIFKIGEILNVKIYVPTPPKSQVKLFVNIKENDEKGKVIIENEEVNIKNSLATYTRRIEESGSYIFETTLKFIDTTKKAQHAAYRNGFEYTVVSK